MGVTYVELRYLPRVRWAALRELCGRDQQLVQSIDTAVAIHLLNSLLVAAPGPWLHPGMAARLTAADRDRLLAAVYRSTYGPRIAGMIGCVSCRQQFEIDFDLAALDANLADAAPPAIPTDSGLTYRLADGRLIRLPTGEDELAVAHLAAGEARQALLQRCVVDGEWAADPAAVETALQAVAPLLDADLDAQCPECGHGNRFAFNIQHFLLGAIAAEARQLHLDIHRIAAAYGWELATILELPRSSRRQYVELIERDASRITQRSYAL